MLCRRNAVWIVFITTLALSLVISCCGGRSREGCEPEGNFPESGSDSITVEPHLTEEPQDPAQIEVVWQEGPHANTYVVADDETNRSCARCHSPLNWIPSSDEMPASWTNNQIEISPSSPLIAEIDWHNVNCKVCHRGEMDQIAGNFAWLEIAPQGIYTEVDTSTALCQKCHLSGDVEGHYSISVEASHSEFLCTDCHDAHNTTATCSSTGCHEPFAAECESIETHDKPHAEVTCSACHDGGEPKIEWNEERQAWDTFHSSSEGNPSEYKPYTSHNIALEVDCDRCHAPGDHPWDP